MRKGQTLAAAVIVAALAGCGSGRGGSAGATNAAGQGACKTATAVVRLVSGPMARRNAQAAEAAATKGAATMNALIDHYEGQAYGVRAAIDAMGGDIASLTNLARIDKDTNGSYGWWNALGYMRQFRSDSRALDSACSGKGTTTGGGSAASVLPFAAQRVQAQWDAFDNSHPGEVTCEADVEDLVIGAHIVMGNGGLAITPDEALSKYPGSPAAVAIYTYYYNTEFGNGTSGIPSVTAIQDRCIRLLYGSGSQPAVAPSQSPVAAAPTPSRSSSPDPYSVGCPTSAQLLAAWNAAAASARASWTTLTVTGFFGTECWQRWVVTNPIMQGNGPAIFTDTSGQLALFPATDLSEFDAAVCGVAGSPSDWSGPAGPATCS